MSTAHTCHDCGAAEGMIHELGCDMEECPFCGGQLIGCECCYRRLGIDVSPGTWAYHNGLAPKQEEHWLAMLVANGRIPYIVYPNMCARCGQLWPTMFHVPDAEWQRCVPKSQRHKMLCRACYSEIKGLIDVGAAT